MKKRIFKIVIIILSIFVLIFGGQNILSNISTAFALGDLTINWGVPSGDPIFVVNNMLPADSEQRDVDVTNNGSVLREVAVRGVKVSETLEFADILMIVIMEGVNTLYGPKTLEQFFTDSLDPSGIFLSNLNPSDSKTYSFKVTFPAEAGNGYQNAEVIFDLTIGIHTDVPSECQQINFSGDPIFGTSGSDKITGTPGNDLIFGLEGHDKIEGNLGDDCIVGGLGRDQLIGNDGNDVILGDEGDDSLEGGNGNDLMEGGSGNDSLDGGDGNDYMDGGVGGQDSGNGQNGIDTCNNFESQINCEL